MQAGGSLWGSHGGCGAGQVDDTQLTLMTKLTALSASYLFFGQARSSTRTAKTHRFLPGASRTRGAFRGMPGTHKERRTSVASTC